MEQRRSLILRVYRRQQARGRDVVGACEDPQSGRQQPFRTQEELWSIVLAALDQAGDVKKPHSGKGGNVLFLTDRR